MNRLLALARPAPVSRKLLYRLLSLVIIASMLLQPLTTIAVTTKAPLVSLVARTTPDLRSAVVPPAISDAAAQARPFVIPAAKARAVEEVSPTPSGALPPYPVNHTLNPAYTYFGDTLPTNGDLSIPGYNVGTPPANYDFSAAPYAVGTPPTNYDFATGDFSDWTTSGTTAIQSDATRGPWAELKTSAVITQPVRD